MEQKICDDCKHFRERPSEAKGDDWYRCHKNFETSYGRVACIEHETKEAE